jgi:hypothetical protein
MTDVTQDVSSESPDDAPVKSAHPARRPLYPRLLHLQHIHPNAWQRALLGEGALGIATLLVLADLATAWTLLVLPVAVALVVKAHDLLAGRLNAPAPDPEGPAPSYDEELGLRGT